jgi:hypothetical protein
MQIDGSDSPRAPTGVGALRNSPSICMSHTSAAAVRWTLGDDHRAPPAGSHADVATFTSAELIARREASR